MKKLVIFTLTLSMIMLLVGCSNTENTVENTNTNMEETVVATNEEKNNTTTTDEVTLQEETSKWEIDPKADTIDVDTTIAWLDSLSIEDRYDWYAERFGEAFTEHLIDRNDAMLIDPANSKYDIFIEAYYDMPCELAQLFWKSSNDFIAAPYNAAIGERDGAEAYKILSACNVYN